MRALPSLRQLRYLVTLIELRHFSRSAEACLVTQSTLSAGIRELEDLLGVTLFERTKRTVTPTPIGLEIGEEAKALLRDAERLLDIAETTRKPLSGSLRLGVIPTIGPYALPQALPGLRARFPKLRLYLREDQTARLLDRLDDGELDAVLMALPWETPELEVMVLIEDPFFVVSSRLHPFAGATGAVDVAALRPPNLAPDDLLLLEEGHCMREHALAACALNRGGRARAFQATSIYTLVQMVANGLGVTLLPSIAVNAEALAAVGITARPLAGDAGRKIALVWRHRSPRAAEFRLLGSILKDQMLTAQAASG
jgi:LysR family transcriptional regulator, hydrogen peroxide-inducible genes activator